jgi:hypothetical protein
MRALREFVAAKELVSEELVREVLCESGKFDAWGRLTRDEDEGVREAAEAVLDAARERGVE